ncbi:MAG: hypothetical protein VKS61_01715 [Candidatus Sericytochromatia bacterium]|nr:hypothetical protein [Candidatus Sericytochromatia bacterium]
MVELVGKVKLISDQGGGVISATTGQLISDQGGSLISDQGGALVGKARFLMATPRAEAALAGARVQFYDATGRQLVGRDQLPLAVTTDRSGAFLFRGELPVEAVVARVQAFHGANLQALLARDAAGASTLAIDTASSLATAFVLDRFVAGRQEVADRLPSAEAYALRAEMERARGLLGDRVPTYRAAEAVQLAEQLRQQDPGVARRLEAIRSLLLVGQAGRGEGLAATEVALGAPIAVAADASGRLLVAELAAGRIRAVGEDGRIVAWAGGNATSPQLEGPVGDLDLQAPAALVLGPDGTLYVADRLANRVWGLREGRARVVVGNGDPRSRAVDVPGPEAGLKGPVALAIGAGGRLWIAEHTKDAALPSRLLVLDAAGVVREVPPPSTGGALVPAGLAVTPDGALWLSDAAQAYTEDGLPTGTLWRRDPDGTWRRVLEGEAISTSARLLPLQDGAVLLSRDTRASVVRVTPDGAITPIAGTGTAGFEGDGGPAAAARLNTPAGLALDAAGALLIADTGNGVVRKVLPPLDGTGTIATVAGRTGYLHVGASQAIALNAPGGMALDAAGRLLFTEGGSSTLKRLEGGRVTVLAGGVRGFGGDGGPARDARLNAPTGVAARGDEIFLVELDNHRLRRIDAAGVISTVAGNGQREGNVAPLAPALEVPLRRGLACAVAPDGRLYWADNDAARLYRLRADGQAEVVAGAWRKSGFSGDGGPAREALLSAPTGLAFDARGDLYVVDAGNFRIRRITGLAGAAPTIDTVVGAETWVAALTQPVPAGATAGLETPVAGGTALTFDAAGALYYAELGPRRMATLLGGGFELPLDGLAPRGPRICRVMGLGGGEARVEPVAGMGTALMADARVGDALHTPMGLLHVPGQGLYVLDTGNDMIRLLPQAALGPR